MIAFGVRGVLYGKHVPLNGVCAKLALQRQNSIQFHASCLTEREASHRIFSKNLSTYCTDPDDTLF